MTILGQIDPLNYASLKPAFAASEEEAANRVQQQVAQVQLTNAQDEQQRNAMFRASLTAIAKAPSVEGYTKLLSIAPKEYVEGLKASIAQMDSAERKTLADQAAAPWISGVNGRPDLMKAKLEEQAAGFESKGKTVEAEKIRDMIKAIDTDPDGASLVTARLGQAYLAAAGPEKFNALMASTGIEAKRRKELADMRKAEGEGAPEFVNAKLKEQLGKAQQEGAKGRTAEELATAQLKTAQTEAEFKRKQEESQIQARADQSKKDLADAEHTEFLTRRDRLTERDYITKASQEARTARANADTAEYGATPEALKAKAEQDKQHTELYKAQVSQIKDTLGGLPAHVQASVEKDLDASTESMAAAVRARTIADGYRRISAGASTGTPAKLGEWARKVAGTQNQRDALNQLAQRALNNEIITEAQKIRPVSNEDTAMLQKGLPDPRGNPKLVVDFMDALARTQERAASFAADKAAWKSEFKGVGNAREDTNVNGHPVKKGMSFVDFIRSQDDPHGVVGKSREELLAMRAAELAKGKK